MTDGFGFGLACLFPFLSIASALVAVSAVFAEDFVPVSTSALAVYSYLFTTFSSRPQL